jgi:hypothetical protein
MIAPLVLWAEVMLDYCVAVSSSIAFESRAEPALREASAFLQMRLIMWARQGMKLCRPRNRMKSNAKLGVFIVTILEKHGMKAVTESPIVGSIVPRNCEELWREV